MKPKKVIFNSNKQKKGEKHGVSSYPTSSTYYPHPTAPIPTPSSSQLPPKTKAALESVAVTKLPKKTVNPPSIQIETKQAEEKLSNLTKQSRIVLFKCSSVFPFDFFPDEMSIEPTQVNLNKKIFFWTDRMTSVPIKNISDVIVQTGPFFASISVLDQFFKENSVEIMWLKKSDAQRARKIIQGLIVAVKENIDIARIEPRKLVKQAEELGEMQAIG